MLKPRDKQIIAALNKFRVMDRDSIAELFFSSLKNPKLAANNVLLRLYRDKQIDRSTDFVPFLYFGPETEIKKNSAKINHFLAILEVYKEMHSIGQLEAFQVEPKYLKKGAAEPDIFARYRETDFFIEVQRTVYSEKQMNEKMGRYVDLYDSGVMGETFPHVLILSEQRYGIEPKDYSFKIFQAESFKKFNNSLKPNTSSTVVKSKGIKIVLNNQKGAI